MSEKSKALDGDWQGDGFGISWVDENNSWQEIKSTKPIWLTTDLFSKIPRTKLLSVHARSATFKSQMQEGDTSYNQPYNNSEFSFVFNGHLKGVKLKRVVPGKIGAEKIWNLLLNELEKNGMEDSLKNIDQFLTNHTEEIGAMNIGVADKNNIYALCHYKPNDINPDYHNLWSMENAKLKMICSEPLQGFEMTKMKNLEIIKL
ncbi:MAG TPA: class II glutamine amidotransferase [Candidatus Dojkabacteria bacterium]